MAIDINGILDKIRTRTKASSSGGDPLEITENNDELPEPERTEGD